MEPALPDHVFEGYKDQLNNIKGKFIQRLCFPEMKSVGIDFVNICIQSLKIKSHSFWKTNVTCNHCATLMRPDNCKKKFFFMELLLDKIVTMPESIY